MGSEELIPAFALLVYADFALPVNPSLSRPWVLSLFKFFLNSAGGSEPMAAWYLVDSCG